MKHKKILISSIVIMFALISACTPSVETADETKNTPTEVVPTATATETQEPTATIGATATLTPVPTFTKTPTLTSVQLINELIVQDRHQEAIDLTVESVEAGEFTSMNEAILEVWLPVIRTESDYSDAVIERLSPRLSGLEVNEAGLAVIVDSKGDVLIEKTAPGVSNVEWAIPIVELAYGIEGEERERAARAFSVISKEGEFFFDSGLKAYNFPVVFDNVTQLSPPVELPGGTTITGLAHFYYYDENENLQKISTPFFAYNEENLSMYGIGGLIGDFNSSTEFYEFLNKTLAWRDQNKGPMAMGGRNDLQYGDIVFLSFNLQASSEYALAAREFYGETMGLYHEQSSLDSFAQSGAPSILPKINGEPMLLPLLESTNNSLSGFQD